MNKRWANTKKASLRGFLVILLFARLYTIRAQCHRVWFVGIFFQHRRLYSFFQWGFLFQFDFCLFWKYFFCMTFVVSLVFLILKSIFFSFICLYKITFFNIASTCFRVNIFIDLTSFPFSYSNKNLSPFLLVCSIALVKSSSSFVLLCPMFTMAIFSSYAIINKSANLKIFF